MTWNTVFTDLKRIHVFIQLAVEGLRFGAVAKQSVADHRRVAKVLNKPDPYGSEAEFEYAMARASDFEEFSLSQSSTDFSYVYELGTIKLWSILESSIDGLTIKYIRDNNEKLQLDSLMSIEGPLLPFMKLSEEEKSDFLISKLKISLRSSLKIGAGRFEALLDSVGLGGNVDPAAAKALVDLSETRHLIVHRGGVVDKTFLKKCPWRGEIVGQKLLVNRKSFGWYMAAADWYVVEIDARETLKRSGVRPSENDLLLVDLKSKIVDVAKQLGF
jgi:hypothetical protein